jgi:hypothetical protein
MKYLIQDVGREQVIYLVNPIIVEIQAGLGHLMERVEE